MSIMNTLNIAGIKLSGSTRTADHFLKNATVATPIQSREDEWKNYFTPSQQQEYDRLDKVKRNGHMTTAGFSVLMTSALLAKWYIAPAMVFLSGPVLPIAYTGFATAAFVASYKAYKAGSKQVDMANAAELERKEAIKDKMDLLGKKTAASSESKYVPPNLRP